MKTKEIVRILINWNLVVFLMTAGLCVQSQGQSINDLEKLLADSVIYQYGKDRRNLNAIDEIIQRTQSPDKRREIERLFAKYLTNAQATVEFKEYICRHLWYLGTAESVNAVATLLTDEKTIGWGCYALVRNTSKEATEALINALNSVPAALKPKIISALGQKRDPLAVAALSKYCEDENPEIASAAITALGQIASKDSLGILWKLVNSGNKNVAEQAAHSLILCAESLSKSGNFQEALDICTKIYGMDFPIPIKVAAMRGIVQNSKDSGVEFIIKSLKSDDYKTRIAGAGAINLVKDSEALRQIVKAIPELPAVAQTLAINVLADKREPSLLPVVKELLKSDDKQVRIESIKALGQVGDSSCVSILAELMTSPDPQERAFAKSSLITMNNKGVDKEILNILAKADVQPQIRIDIIEVILARDMADAVPELIKMCGSTSNPEIQRAALRAIGKLGSPSVLPDLLKLTFSLADEKARLEGEAAVVSVAGKIADKDNRSAQVVKLWGTAKDDKAKESVIRIAGGIADQTALSFLSKIVTQQDGNLCDLAVRELANWEDPSALPVLEKIYKETKNETHRALAFRTYVRLLKSATGLSANELFKKYNDAFNNARNAEEKKLVMSGLASVPTIDALNFCLKMLGDEYVKNESAQAILSISASIYGAEPDAARNAIATVVKADIDNNVKQQAQLLLKQIEELGSYIRTWELSGPYSVSGKNYDALFDIPFAPEEGKPGVKWIPAPLSADPKRPYVIDLLKIFGGEQCVAYARCYVYSPVQQKARLELGSDDGVKVWLNGKLVYSLNVARPLTPNSDKTDIVLNQGWNPLMMKITQNNQGWEFCVRIVTLDGKMIDGIRYSIKPQ